MILTEAQARAVYSAMVELNNVSGQIGAKLPSKAKGVWIHIKEFVVGDIQVWYGDQRGHSVGITQETYENQTHFATVYKVL